MLNTADSAPSNQRLIADLETNGLLQQLTKIHILVAKDIDTGENYVYRHNNRENTILEGIERLNNAALIVGHNWVGFDQKALWKVYGDRYQPKGIVRDSMVMTRMLFADAKERDFRLWKRQQLDGEYIGSHELAAWGQRLGFPKGDYKDVKETEAKALGITDKAEIAKFVWGEWNREMEEYAIRDVEVTYALWQKVEERPWSEFATKLEHSIHDLMERTQDNGFPLDIPLAQKLEEDMRESHERMSKTAIEHFGSWWVPKKWLKTGVSTTYYNPATKESEKNLPNYRPRADFGEDDTRQHWGEVQIPKKTTKFKEIMKGDTEAGCPFTPVKLIEFNPNSRQQIVNRLEKIYGWEPQEFTEKGQAKVDDDVLRDLAKTVEICDVLAEIFYFKKRLGQLVDGKNGLIGKALERGDNKIHARTNCGGTVTNRASHSNPNIAQVPRVVFKNLLQWEQPDVAYSFDHGKIIYGIWKANEDGVKYLDRECLKPLLDPDGKQFVGRPEYDNEARDYKRDDAGKIKLKKTLLKGRAGDHGWDFRNLFYVPEGWKLMGADQKGIELRALGHYMSEFDNGEYLKLVVESDPHDLHQAVMELDSRDTAKTAIYAMIYGAQDYKLGITCDPTLAMYPSKAKALGAEMRRRLMTRIPAFGAVVKASQRDAKRGYVEALDGRHLFVRSQHAVLNTKLQGAAATVAKLWCVYFEQFCEDEGLVHGWDGDFAVLAWIHDELQIAVRDDPRILAICERNVKEAAVEAGIRLNFRAPVDIDVKFGMRWSETH
jgi:DNA polymerase I-like protein with 3'-5' exonuclease and polymerase domains